MNQVAPLRILKASAGSGKTFSLTLHYITLLLINEKNYKEILAVTFTNKATAEMKERILSVLEGLATKDESPKINAFRQALKTQQPQWDDVFLQQKSHRVYRNILHDYSRFTVSTIDGFSQKVIRSFTYELNLDAAYKIEMNVNKVKTELTYMLNKSLDDRPELLQWMIEYAEAKIANNENWNFRQQLMKLAGMIFTENFQEFDKNVNATDVNELFNRINDETEHKTKNFLEALSLGIQTFNETLQQLNVSPDDLKGLSRNKINAARKISPNVSKLSTYDLIKTVDRYLAIRDSENDFLDRNGNFRYDIHDALRPILDNFQLLEQNLSSFIAYKAVQSKLYFLRLLKEMSDLLSKWRKDNEAQLISDSQILLNKLGLDENQDPTFIWERIGNRYNYFLFDEFQDTSRIQWKNYSPLLLNALAKSHRKVHEHLIVGDVKQSIYRWRNGDWRILLQQVEQQVAQNFHLNEQEKQDFILNDTLNTNYRSLPNIIDFNNHIFHKLPVRLQEVLNQNVLAELDDAGQRWWTETGNEHMLTKAYENSTQEIPQDKQLNSAKRGSIDIVYLPVENNRHRASQVNEAALETMAAHILKWLQSGRYRPEQIGILVRKNNEATMVVQRLMELKQESGLEFEVISGDVLTVGSNMAVQLLVETLKALTYSSLEHTIYKANITFLFHQIKTQSFFEQQHWLKFSPNKITDLKDVLPKELIDQWTHLTTQPLVHLIEKLIEIYGLSGQKNPHLPYILAFKDLTASFSSNGERGIIPFLTYWEEDGISKTLPSSGKAEAIEVTTIHKSKGLAYDVVMIPFCSWPLDANHFNDFWLETYHTEFDEFGKIPIAYSPTLSKSSFYKQYFEEMLFNYMDALNTFYVAATRAVEHLHIIAPHYKDAAKTAPPVQYIGDILYQVLSEAETPYTLHDTSLHIDNVIPTETQPERKNENMITLSSYPISRVLERALEKSERRQEAKDVFTIEKAAQHGILAHDILSKVVSEQEISIYIKQFVEQGILKQEEESALQTEILKVWHHPTIRQWLTGDYKIWNEAAIITAQGETIRPDKVFSSPEETIVLDFKFTQSDYVDHKFQIDQYVKTLIDLGYKNVKGYLFYAKTNLLEEVK